MEKKKTTGRRRLEMKAIGDESRRHVAFSKRKAGIFNKAAELSILTGAEVVVIVFSKYGKAYTFSTPGADAVISSLLGGGGAVPEHPTEDADCAAAKREVRRLEDSSRRQAEQRKRERAGGFWWDRPTSADAEPEELGAFLEALVELRGKVAEMAASAAVRPPSKEDEGSFSALLIGNGDHDAIHGMIMGSPSSEVYN